MTDGKWQCLNPDATIHWDQCSANRWEQVKATGTKFEDKDHLGREIAGYKDSIHGTKLERISAKVIKGKKFKAAPARDLGLLPWTGCASMS